MSARRESDASDNGCQVSKFESLQNGAKAAWRNNKGVFLILLAQVTGSTMDAIARFLQQGKGGSGMHSFQVIFARMSVTALLSTIYMWWTKVPDFPLGAREVRGWLILRAFSGFCGLFCLYYSVHYLPLAEATVLRFLVPIITAWACYVFLGQVFTRTDLCVGIIALIGVVIIAHPAEIFGSIDNDNSADSPHQPNRTDDVTPSQRLLAIVVAVLGVLGASGAYTIIRVIGTRAHALMSVNYFAIICTLGSTLALLLLPNISFTRPQNGLEWLLLLLLGILGFILQFLLTAGLQLDKTSRATSMLYTQILFALAFDWAVWGVLPGLWSCVGGAVIIVSTLWSALQKSKGTAGSSTAKSKDQVVDEESALLGAQTEGSEEAVHAESHRRSG